MDIRREIIENGKYNRLWMAVCLAGVLIMIVGMFGVIGLIGVPASGAVFAIGVTFIVFPAAIIFYNSYRLGLFSDTDVDVQTENKKRVSHHKRKK